MSLHQQGKHLRDVVCNYREAIKVLRAALRKNNSNTIKIDLAWALIYDGQHQEAINTCCRMKNAQSFLAIAQALMYQGKHNLSKEYHERALLLLKPNDPFQAFVYRGLGLLFGDQAYFDLAVRHHIPNSNELADTLNSRGVAYYNKADFVKAWNAFTEAFRIKCDYHKNTYHVDMYHCMHNLAIVLCAYRYFAEALFIQQQAYYLYARIQHPKTDFAHKALFNILRQLNNQYPFALFHEPAPSDVVCIIKSVVICS